MSTVEYKGSMGKEMMWRRESEVWSVWSRGRVG